MKITICAHSNLFTINTEAKLRKGNYGYHNGWWLVKILKVLKNKSGTEYECLLPNGQSLILKNVRKIIASSVKLKNMPPDLDLKAKIIEITN